MYHPVTVKHESPGEFLLILPQQTSDQSDDLPATQQDEAETWATNQQEDDEKNEEEEPIIPYIPLGTPEEEDGMELLVEVKEEAEDDGQAMLQVGETTATSRCAICARSFHSQRLHDKHFRACDATARTSSSETSEKSVLAVNELQIKNEPGENFKMSSQSKRHVTASPVSSTKKAKKVSQRSKLIEPNKSLVLDAVMSELTPKVIVNVRRLTATSGTKLGGGEWTAPKDNASISGQYSALNPNKKTLEKKNEVGGAAADDDAAETKGYVGVIAALKKMNKEPLLALFKTNGFDDETIKVLNMSSDVEMKLLGIVGIEKPGDRIKLIKFVQNFHADEGEPKPKRIKTEKKEKENNSRNGDKKIKKER